jgi:hypothetical protein
MSTYHVSFFKNLLSSDGHPFKCLQRRIDVTDAESAAQAAESASRSFEAVCGCPWKLHADSMEINASRSAHRDAIKHSCHLAILMGLADGPTKAHSRRGSHAPLSGAESMVKSDSRSAKS